MTDMRTAAQQALEALKMMRDEYGEANCPACDHADAAMYALNDALAEPVQEAVAWMWEHQLNDLKHYGYSANMRAWTNERRPGSFEGLVPLFTAPPQRKPLTKEEIHTLRLSIPATTPFLDAVVLYTRAVEAAHGIK